MRLGLRVILASEARWEVVGEAGDGEAAVALATCADPPDVILMDVRMPGPDGIEATRRIAAAGSSTRVLMLTTFEIDEYVYESLRAGASGFVLKRIPPAQLIEAVRVVGAGESLLFPASTRWIIERYAAQSGRDLPRLSDREQDVLRLLAPGLSNAEIAREPFVSVETVKSHVGALLVKLVRLDRRQSQSVVRGRHMVTPLAAERRYVWRSSGASVNAVIVRLLGPVDVTGPHGAAVLIGRRQRALIGALAMNAGQTVTAWRLVDALWGPEPPRTAMKTLHGHVARLRRVLQRPGLAETVVTSAAGYALYVARDDVDGLLFEDLVVAARAEIKKDRLASAVQRLREGLALWRGDPVQDGDLFGWGEAEIVRLRELRLTAVEDLCDVQLRLGDHASAVAELQRASARHPLRERMVELLMLGLYRSGRPGEALEAYEQLRTRLADELGADPAPTLQRLHTSILRHDVGLVLVTSQPLRPAQLPPRVGHFTGRRDQLRELDEAFDRTGDTHLVAVSGAGGMGKTALVVQWAHGVRDQFPDGQVFLDLRGHDDRLAMTTETALAHALRALGMPDERMPSQLAEKVDALRSVLDGRRVLIVLDNAATVGQVLPLVPPSPACLLVITSRRPMAALATYHSVRSISLDAMGPGEALELLRDVVGGPRIDREPADAARIVAGCAGLPLALRIAAARLLHGQDTTLADLATDLSTVDGLDALRVEGDSRTVRTVFAGAYRALSTPAARLFRHMGLHPGVDFGRHLAAAVTGLPPAGTDRALGELVDAHLLGEVGGGRFRYHDLIALYAAECARIEDGPPVRAAAVVRILDWYLGVADIANRVLDTVHDQIAAAPARTMADPPFAPDPQQTLAFLDAERANLLPVVRLATENGGDAEAWKLVYLLTGFFDSRGRWADRIELCRVGLAAAQRLHDPLAEGLMGSALGTAYIRMLLFTEALDCLYPAMEVARAAGDSRGEGRIRNSIATAYARLRRYDEAVDIYQRALAVHQAADDRAGMAVALNNIGATRVRMGRPESGLTCLTDAVRIAQELGDQRMEALIRCSVGEAHLARGDQDAAVDMFQRALEIQQKIDDRRHQIDTLRHIGAVLRDRGEHAAAMDRLRAALSLSQGLGDHHSISVCLTALSTVHMRRGEFDPAGECLRQALAIRATMPDAYEEAAIHRALFDLARQTGQDSVAHEHRQRATWLYQRANATTEAAELEAPR